MNAIQDRLDDVYLGASNLTATKTPFLDFVLSPENVATFDLQKRMSRDGKVRSVELRFDQAKLASEVSSNLSGCTATGTDCQNTKDYTFNPDLNRGMDFTLGLTELTESFETNTETIAKALRLRMDAIKEAISIDLATAAVAAAGAWSGDTSDIDGVAVANDVLQVNTTLANGTGAARIANPVLFEQIRTALEMSNYGTTGIFGGNELASYVRRAIAGSDSAVGYNLRAMLDAYGIGATYDRNLATVLSGVGAATNLAVGLGSIAPVGFSLYAADGAKIRQEDSIADTIYDPATGMMFDFRMTRPCDEWLIQVRSTYQFFYLPDDRYKAGHNLERVNGIGQIGVTCSDLASC